jgi:hypothetical protein
VQRLQAVPVDLPLPGADRLLQAEHLAQHLMLAHQGLVVGQLETQALQGEFLDAQLLVGGPEIANPFELCFTEAAIYGGAGLP